MDAYVYRVAKYIGAYTVAMNGVDAIAFTAGLGENDDATRAAIGEYLDCIGAKIDAERTMCTEKQRSFQRMIPESKCSHSDQRGSDDRKGYGSPCKIKLLDKQISRLYNRQV